MPANGQIGSMGVGSCPCHPPLPPVSYTTVIVSGAPTVNTNAVNTAFITSMGVASCGHATVAITGSGTVFANGSGVHRVGDIGNNCGMYTLITGSPNVFSGG